MSWNETIRVGAVAVLLAGAGSARAAEPAPRAKATPAAVSEDPVPAYTDADLRRLSALRHQTGAESVPAVAPQSGAEPRGDDDARRNRDETYWRREADRLRERLRPLRQRADRLREQIDERWRAPGVAPVTDPKLLAWRRQLDDVERRVRDAESRLEERARRARALPGWLR